MKIDQIIMQKEIGQEMLEKKMEEQKMEKENEGDVELITPEIN